MKRQFFGTDGVRGPYGGAVINEEFAEKLGLAAGRWLAEKGRVLIGRDTRASGSSLEAALAKGIRAAGATPVSLGIVPTPAVARAVVQERASLGVVITASHNPAEDNGIKFFGTGGTKLTDDQELAIEARLIEDAPARSHAEPIPQLVNAANDYMAVTQRILRPGALTGWRIVLDTANGATCGTSPRVLQNLGAEVISVGVHPNGSNINAGVGSEHPEKLAAAVQSHRATLGVAHDGDGDRCVLCDEKGSVLDGDEILTILATHALHRGSLAKNVLVATVQSNLGVDAAIAAAGGRVSRTSVGDRYVIERMLELGATLGGESSGHVICADVSPTGDGLVAALKVIEVMLATKKPLSELRRVLVKFPQVSRALLVQQKKPLNTLPELTSVILRWECQLGDRGRVLVRYSGTESKLRLLVEGPSDAVVNDAINDLENSVRRELHVLDGSH